jgi:hypothetical protein
MVKGLVRNVPLGRGAPTARPEHMLALKEHLSRPEAALCCNYYPIFRPGFPPLSLHARGIPSDFNLQDPLTKYHVPHRANVFI